MSNDGGEVIQGDSQEVVTLIISRYRRVTREREKNRAHIMASPHTAGLLAYLLSIYPSEHFDPSFDSAENLVSIHPEHILRDHFLYLYWRPC